MPWPMCSIQGVTGCGFSKVKKNPWGDFLGFYGGIFWFNGGIFVGGGDFGILRACWGWIPPSPTLKNPVNLLWFIYPCIEENFFGEARKTDYNIQGNSHSHTCVVCVYFVSSGA